MTMSQLKLKDNLMLNQHGWKACILLAALATPLSAETPRTGSETHTARTVALEKARTAHSGERQRLRVAAAKLTPPALERCLLIGRLTGWLDAIDGELKMRSEELGRLQSRPEPDAFELAVQCRERIKELEHARRQFLEQITKLEEEHLQELIRDGKLPLKLAPSPLTNILPHKLPQPTSPPASIP